MCGRLDQNDIDRVLNDFSWANEVVRRSRAELLFNAAPGTLRPILHMAGGALVIDDRWWMYKAPGSPATVRPTPNARLDKIAGRYWGRLIGTGRIIVPANGWYEWTGEKPNKRPWHIHRADGELLYMAALTAWDAGSEDRNASGFAIVTDDAEGGMVDVHDRRPVVFSASLRQNTLLPGRRSMPWTVIQLQLARRRLFARERWPKLRPAYARRL